MKLCQEYCRLFWTWYYTYKSNSVLHYLLIYDNSNIRIANAKLPQQEHPWTTMSDPKPLSQLWRWSPPTCSVGRAILLGGSCAQHRSRESSASAGQTNCQQRCTFQCQVPQYTMPPAHYCEGHGPCEMEQLRTTFTNTYFRLRTLR